ncbi:MAG: hypothetical protein EA393_06350 [Bacteroidetes bacterium]|nr:MAG: hypothetical protein EA393_06350 [Bacteroidota bacterium]
MEKQNSDILFVKATESTGQLPSNNSYRAKPVSGLKMFFLLMFLMGQLAGSPAQTPDRIAQSYSKQLVRVFEYRDSLEGVHPFIKGLYPIAIAEDGYFYVFDLDSSKTQYRIMTYEEIEMKVPRGTRAAFPLQFYDDKCACVVTGDVFDSPEGYVVIFHEFIHCHQWHTVEPGLRSELPLAVKSQEAGNVMWEVEYPFPYQDKWFVKTYNAFLKAANDKDHVKVAQLREELAGILNDDDYQYMVWQEWKEGFALFLENKMRKHLNLPENKVGRQEPYSRTVFYAGGSAYIEFLTNENPDLLTDLEALFYKMYFN